MMRELSSAQRERITRWAALALCMLFAVTGALVFARLVWLFVPRADTGIDRPVTDMPANPNANAATVAIAKWHLFGNPEIATNVVRPRNAPNSTLKLSLHGTLALENPKAGMAMIADEQGEHAFHVGEMVADGARLDAVYVDRVIIVHEGATETLELPKPEEHPIAAPPAPNARNAAGTAAITPLYTPPVMAAGAVDWKEVQKKYNVDPEELKKNVQVLPVMENGKFAGVRLNAGPNAALFSKLGLQPNDIVVAVNGTSVSNLNNAQQIMDSLKNSSQLQVTVKRDGKPATLTVSLK